VETHLERHDKTIRDKMQQCWKWLLVPIQEPGGDLEWDEFQLQRNGGLVARAARKLQENDLLVPKLAASILRSRLDDIPLWQTERGHIRIWQLWEHFCQYPYLDRLQGRDVLLEAIREGAGRFTWERDGFAYAESYDESEGRYRGLAAGGHVSGITLNQESLIVRPDVAKPQLDEERVPAGTEAGAGAPDPDPAGNPGEATAPTTTQGRPAPEATKAELRRFYGSVPLKATKMSSQAGQIAEAVVAHLEGLVGAKVHVSLEISAELPSGVSEDVVRTVRENCRTLKFEAYDFETE
jgi:hypothetical protein